MKKNNLTEEKGANASFFCALNQKKIKRIQSMIEDAKENYPKGSLGNFHKDLANILKSRNPWANYEENQATSMFCETLILI